MTLEHGMDSSRIRQVASGIDIEAGRLGDILGRGNASAGLLRDNWGGDDSQQLLIRWQREAARSLGAATELLRGAAKELRQQAQDQDEGSGVGGGGTGGPGGPGPGPGSQRPISGPSAGTTGATASGPTALRADTTSSIAAPTPSGCGPTAMSRAPCTTTTL